MNIYIGEGVKIQGGNIYIGRTALEPYYFITEDNTAVFITEDGNYFIDQDYYIQG